MTLGKPHLIASLALLAASIVYNLWVFTQPAKVTTPSRAPAPVQPLPSREDTAAANAPVDVTSVPPPPEVALDRLPEWPRDPFARTRDLKPAVAPAVEAPTPAPEPDLVVSSILMSPERRLAIVNGQIFRVGDTIQSARIVDIQPRAVIVESPTRGRQTIELQMFRSAGATKGARK